MEYRSTSLEASMAVFNLMKELLALHSETSDDAAESVSLNQELGVLAKRMLRQEWRAPAGLPQPRLGKV